MAQLIRAGSVMNKKQDNSELPINEAAVKTRIEKKQVEERVAITVHVVDEAILSGRRRGIASARRGACMVRSRSLVSHGFLIYGRGSANFPCA